MKANAARTAVAIAVISAERSLDMGEGYAAWVLATRSTAGTTWNSSKTGAASPPCAVREPIAGGLMGILSLHAASAKPAAIVPQIKGVVLIVNAFIDVPMPAPARKPAARDKVRDAEARTLAEVMEALAAVRTTPG